MIKLIAYVLKAFAWIISHLPKKVQFFLGDVIGILWFDILRIRRPIIISNLTLAFPTMSEKKRIQLARRSMCNLGRGFIEFCHFPFMENHKSI